MLLLPTLQLVRSGVIYVPGDDPACLNQTDGYTYREDSAINCRQFSVCIKERLITLECPIGFSFNPNDGSCDTTYNNMCEENNICPPDTNTTLFAKVGSCSEYYECTNGVSTVKKCPNGLEFNSTIDKCDLPSTDNKCISCPKLADEQSKRKITIQSENSCNQ